MSFLNVPCRRCGSTMEKHTVNGYWLFCPNRRGRAEPLEPLNLRESDPYQEHELDQELRSMRAAGWPPLNRAVLSDESILGRVTPIYPRSERRRAKQLALGLLVGLAFAATLAGILSLIGG